MRYLFLLCLACFSLSAKAGDTTAFTGTWKASQKGKYVYFVFGTDSSLKISQGSDTFLLHYTTDTTMRPMHIDMRVKDRQSGEFLYVNKGIYEWMGENRIRIRWFESPKDRPQSFMPKGNPETLILIRQ